MSALSFEADHCTKMLFIRIGMCRCDVCREMEARPPVETSRPAIADEREWPKIWRQQEEVLASVIDRTFQGENTESSASLLANDDPSLPPIEMPPFSRGHST